LAEVWNKPSKTKVRKALEEWRSDSGVRMANVKVEFIDAPDERKEAENGFSDHGDHYFVSGDYMQGKTWAGRWRLRYRADGVAYLEHVYLEPDFARTGLMTQLLADFLPHYREWGLKAVHNPTPVEAGQKFAQAQGFKPLGGDKGIHVLEVPSE
jgi:GNAT superfamily N-acetyltransferase